MGKRKRSLESINAEVEYLLHILKEGISKGKEGLKERLRVLEKEMLEKGGMHLVVNAKSDMTHAMKNGKPLCGAIISSSYIRVGTQPECQRCTWSLTITKERR